ncbi:MAG: TonB-dependent receptor plug domain-containing protein, partial [Myxococcota bacterium]
MKKLACRPFRTASFAWLALNLATVHNLAVAQTPKPTATSTDTLNLALETPETITIFGKHRDIGRVAGSAHQISSETLTDFEYDDIGRALAKVPGVYIRDEDGFGLRPNIGLRGANSDRSSRVVLLEDGILLGPAPYAAPAAYYVPLFTRMEGVEIFKGPASIQHGPYTVGGAINMMTAQIPVGHAAMGDVALGQFGHGKAHARYGWGGTNFGFLVEGVHLASNGFKELDQDEDADTGFTRNDVMVKFRVNSSPSEAIAHRLDLKFGYGDEASNETYLGLTDDDFAADPLRRYRGSQLARMEWRRFLYEARYSVAFDDDAELRLTAYRHDFTRAWLKLNRFRNLSGTANTPVESVLRDPTGNNELLLRMARGEVSSEEIFSFENVPNLLGIGTNDRTFVSQGVQLDGDYEWNHGSWTQRITAGVRLHYDEIQRRHDEAPYEMVVAA